MLSNRKPLFLIVLLISVFALVITVAAQGIPTATTIANLNVRQAPAVDGALIGTIPVNSTVIVEGRDESSNWALIRTEDGLLRGWGALGYIQFSSEVRVRELPVVSLDAPPPAPVVNPETGEVVGGLPTIEPTPFAFLTERTDLPVISMGPNVMRNVRNIYARGIARGNNPAVFIKVGESNMAGTVFLCNFQYGNYDLGSYIDLQPVIDLFNSTGSFCDYAETAQSGFSSASVFDPLWSGNDCTGNETPLQCELRIRRPMYAIIHLGIADMGFITASQYRTNLNRLVRTLSENGVIPILQTFTMADTFNDGLPQAFVTVIREVATQNNVPLIDVRAQMYDYENRGTGSDGYHLSFRDEYFTSFGGDQETYGRPMRELLTLQVLRDLHAALSGS